MGWCCELSKAEVDNVGLLPLTGCIVFIQLWSFHGWLGRYEKTGYEYLTELLTLDPAIEAVKAGCKAEFIFISVHFGMLEGDIYIEKNPFFRMCGM